MCHHFILLPRLSSSSWNHRSFVFVHCQNEKKCNKSIKKSSQYLFSHKNSIEWMRKFASLKFLFLIDMWGVSKQFSCNWKFLFDFLNYELLIENILLRVLVLHIKKPPLDYTNGNFYRINFYITEHPINSFIFAMHWNRSHKTYAPLCLITLAIYCKFGF